MDNRWAISAIYSGDTSVFSGEFCWLVKQAGPMRRCVIGVCNRRGEWIEKWVHVDTLTAYSATELPVPETTDEARAQPFQRFPSKGDTEAAIRELLEALRTG